MVSKAHRVNDSSVFESMLEDIHRLHIHPVYREQATEGKKKEKAAIAAM